MRPTGSCPAPPAPDIAIRFRVTGPGNASRTGIPAGRGGVAGSLTLRGRAVLQSPQGHADILPPESGRRRALIDAFAQQAELAGFGEIMSPIFEDLGVFKRLGESTDVVTKEMFDFFDKGDPPQHLALRPELTASVCRALPSTGLPRRGRSGTRGPSSATSSPRPAATASSPRSASRPSAPMTPKPTSMRSRSAGTSMSRWAFARSPCC